MKILMLISSLLLTQGQQQPAPDREASMMLIKKTIRLEIIYASIVLSIGLILSSIIIYAMIQLGELLQVYLNQFNNGDSIQAIIFSLVVLSAFVLFYMILKIDNQKDEFRFSMNGNKNSLLPFSLENFGSKFVEGFVQGLGPKDEQINNTSQLL